MLGGQVGHDLGDLELWAALVCCRVWPPAVGTLGQLRSASVCTVVARALGAAHGRSPAATPYVTVRLAYVALGRGRVELVDRDAEKSEEYVGWSFYDVLVEDQEDRGRIFLSPVDVFLDAYGLMDLGLRGNFLIRYVPSHALDDPAQEPGWSDGLVDSLPVITLLWLRHIHWDVTEGLYLEQLGFLRRVFTVHLQALFA